MRYTTIIDIRQSSVYRNKNTRLVYLHLALAAGYHDVDRDLVDVSIRRLALDCDVTVAAVRAAIKALVKAHLITREGTLIRVTKWVMTDTISSRPKSKQQQRQIDAAVERKRAEEVRERELEVMRLQREINYQNGTNGYLQYCERLKQLADAGDVEAAKSFARHRARYEAMAAEIKTQQPK